MELNSYRFDPESILLKIQGVQRLAATGGRQNASGGHHAAAGSSKDTLAPDQEAILETVLRGKMELQGLMPWSSNYTFLVKLLGPDDISLLGIYKPGDGERPLWDFPDQTLSQREFTAYLVSQALGWPSIPTTVIRDGPHGLGSVQLFIEAEYEAHYFNMRDMPAFTEDFRHMAVFDYIINNADRKGGHCLKDKNDRIWAIDHGLTFHAEPKLRTVIWEFCHEPIPLALLKDLAHLQNLLEESELGRILADLLSPRELDAFNKRIRRIVSTGQFPTLRSGRNVPFPPI
jgi:hypothetical protein